MHRNPQPGFLAPLETVEDKALASPESTGLQNLPQDLPEI
jgi:hypothetical protein